MDHEERERRFEQALERHLRRDAVGARNKPDVRSDVRDETLGADTCPDAGVLAAFHEGILSDEEMTATTKHIAACSRCQHILLLLEATDEIPLSVETENELQMREPVLSAGVLDVDYAARQKPIVRLAAQPKPALKAPKDISGGRGFKALRWAAPAGAIAAGLLIWFVARDSKVQTISHVENVQVAQEQPRNEQLAAPRPLPTAPPPESVTKTKRLNEPRKDNGRIKQPAVEPGVGATQGSLSDAIANQTDAVSSYANSRANTRQLRNESRDYASRMAARDKSPKISSRQADVSVAPAAAAAAAPPGPSSDSRAQSSASAGEAAKSPAKQSSNATTQIIETHPNGDSLAVPTEQVVTNEKLEFSPSLKKDGFANAKIVLAPKGRVRWRLLAAGRIERSSDGGVTWLPQNSGVNVELLAGSAPSNAVCWIVGREGTILKTTDGGSHWSKVAWPNAGEISGIVGMDAMHAIVYDGTAGIPGRFATNDGGETWFRTNK